MSEAAVEASPTSIEQSKKRGPGRPRKNPRPNESPEKSESPLPVASKSAPVPAGSDQSSSTSEPILATKSAPIANVLDKTDQNEASGETNNFATSQVPIKRGRGRPRKYPRTDASPKPKRVAVTKSEDDDEDVLTHLDDSTDKDFKISQAAKHGGSSVTRGGRRLRERESITKTKRYSPEVKEVSKRGRRSHPPITFPSTSSSHRSLAGDSDEEVGLTPPKRRGRPPKNSNNDRRSYAVTDVDVKKDAENKMVIMLPDGTTYKVDTTGSGSGGQSFKRGGRKRPLDEDYEDYFDEDDLDDSKDVEYKPRDSPSHGLARSRRKVDPRLSSPLDDYQFPIIGGPKGLKSMIATGIKMPKPVRRAAGQSPAKVIIAGKSVISPDGTRATKLTSSSTGKSNIIITTPKSVTVTPTNTSFKHPPKRSYGSMARFIDELPDLGECTEDDNSATMRKLPDRILLVSSDLPLKHALKNEVENGGADAGELPAYLFRQIISPVMSGFPCLICATNTKPYFKEEKDLVAHYSTSHELETDNLSAKFSENIVFICLPRPIVTAMADGEMTILNAPCQYCGDEVRLATVEDMRSHYKEVHSKEIEIIEQEEILNMHKALYCFECVHSATDFNSHHAHMKEAHGMQTFVCKRCAFATQDSTRLKTHYKAKHMISNRMQNLQCAFCNGLVIGVERMNKHIMSSHCVQTSINEYSCTSCLQPCGGKGEDLIAHSIKCTSTNGEATTSLSSEEKYDSKAEGGKKCSFCPVEMPSDKLLALHMSHVHTKWLSRSVLHDTFLMVRHPSGKTDIMPKPPSVDGADGPMRLVDLPSQAMLAEALGSSGKLDRVGHYCFKCDAVIKIYPLFYLHMYNVHKLGKLFECRTGGCKQTFKEAKALAEHEASTGHPQSSVIGDPLSSIACHYCDSYYRDEAALLEHQLSDEHFQKINTIMDKSGNKPEPRNHKCKACHTWFGLTDSFHHHMETESHKHACPYCGLQFALPSSRRTHIQSHHTEKADICEVCHVKQGNKERLFAHLVEHGIVFECNRCMRKFYQREQLNAHMETHGEALQCTWDSCSKRIPRAALSTHIRQHRIESESRCPNCNKSFSNRQLLSAHMEVHEKAEKDAKAILGGARSGHHTIVMKEAQPAATGTTLISITTPSALTQKAPASRAVSGKRVPKLGSSTVAGTPNTGTKLMCCSCNGIFSSQEQLVKHECVVPIVTITGPSGGAAHAMPDETTSDQLEEDPEKLVLDLAAQLIQQAQAEEAEKLKQKQNQLQKVEAIMNQTPVTAGVKPSVAGTCGMRTYSKQQQPQVTPNSNPIQEVRTVGDPDSQHLLGIQDQKLDMSGIDDYEEGPQAAQLAAAAAEANGNGEQLIVVQQPDGQLLQVCVPQGMELEDVIRSLNFSYGGEGDQQHLDEAVSDQQHVDESVNEQEAANAEGSEMQQQQMPDEQQQEGVIYLPVNEDGSCSIDAASLAMITGAQVGSDQTPIIVTSSN